MSADAGRPALATEGAFFQAVWRLITDFEATLPETLTTPVRVTLAGGVAAALYTPTRLSSDVDAMFSHRVLLPAEAMAFYTDADGQRRVVTWDRNYNPILGLLHPDAEAEAWDVAMGPLGRVQVCVLSPVDLAVSKIGRYADPDQADIQALWDCGLLTADDFRKRVTESLAYYVGDTGWIEVRLESLCASWETERVQNDPRG